MGTCEVLNSHYFPLCSGMVINIQYSLLEVFLITGKILNPGAASSYGKLGK